MLLLLCILFFFFNDTATTEIYTLSLHDALPISRGQAPMPTEYGADGQLRYEMRPVEIDEQLLTEIARSEEHTSELQSPCNLVCRLLLEKKKKKILREFTHEQDKQLLHAPSH